MSLARENFIQVNKILLEAKTALGKAKSLVGKSIMIDTDGTTATDGSEGQWATLNTQIGTAITAINTAVGEVYFYPENVYD